MEQADPYPSLDSRGNGWWTVAVCSTYGNLSFPWKGRQGAGRMPSSDLWSKKVSSLLNKTSLYWIRASSFAEWPGLPSPQKEIMGAIRFQDSVGDWHHQERCCPSRGYSSMTTFWNWSDILPSASALTLYIQFSLIISFWVIDSRAMGSTSTHHGDAHIGINSVRNWLMDRLMMI
jgi:hypothetical protein